MRRISIMLLMLLMVAVATTGCVTRTQRQYGYSQPEIIPTVMPNQTAYNTPSAMAPNAGTFQPQYQAMAPAQAQNQIPAYTVRNTYDHRVEGFNPNDVWNGINTAMNVVNTIMHWHRGAHHMPWNNFHYWW